jgi:hypothetical protein
LARYELGLVAAALAALLALGATFGDPARGAGPASQVELSGLSWVRGEDHFHAPHAQLDLDQRTALTSLRGTVGGAAVEVVKLRLGEPETNFEGLHARGSLVGQFLTDVRVERLDLRHDEVRRLGELSQVDGSNPKVPPPSAGLLTLDLARGGLRLSLSGVGWLEGLRLTNGRGDTLTVDTVSIPLGGKEWSCDGVTLTEAGVEKKFERLNFITAELKLLAPQSVLDSLNAVPPEVVLELGSWE